MNDSGRQGPKPGKVLQNFRFALDGLKHAIATERHMKIHIGSALAVLALAIVFKVSKFEFLFLLTAIMLVIIAELINTAVERAADLAHPDFHPLSKAAKDVAAGAVLAAAVFAVIVGVAVFWEPLKRFFATILD